MNKNYYVKLLCFKHGILRSECGLRYEFCNSIAFLHGEIRVLDRERPYGWEKLILAKEKLIDILRLKTEICLLKPNINAIQEKLEKDFSEEYFNELEKCESDLFFYYQKIYIGLEWFNVNNFDIQQYCPYCPSVCELFSTCSLQN